MGYYGVRWYILNMRFFYKTGHAFLVVVAISFVAVKVIVKEEPDFVTKKVKRPKMPPKKLPVPVDVKKRTPKHL